MDESELSSLDLSKIAQQELVRISPLFDSARNITITWNTGKRCNYACSYCWKDLHDKTSPHRTFEDLVKAWLRLREVVKRSGQPARLIFTGGEPTLNPDFARFVEFLHSTQRRWIAQIGMTTNGSESPEYYDALLRNIDFVTFSTHFEFWDEATFMTMLLDLWRGNGKNGGDKWISVNLMYEDWDATSIRRVRDVLQQEGIPWSSYKIINFYGSKGIANRQNREFDYGAYLATQGGMQTVAAPDQAEPSIEAATSSDGEAPTHLSDMLVDDQMAGNTPDVVVELRDGSQGVANATQMMNFELTNFPGWVCNVQNSLYIHNDGVLWAGNCKFKDLGNVYESFEALTEPVVCDGRLCVCVIDIQIEKHKPDPKLDVLVPDQFRRSSYDKKAKSR